MTDDMVTSSTGGKKGQKLAQFSQVPPEIERQIAEIFALGAEKYGRGNWMLGYDWDLNYDAARRHLGEFWAGEDFNKKDFPDHDVKHVLQAAWHCIVLAWFMDNKREFDTRPAAGTDSTDSTVTMCRELPTDPPAWVKGYEWTSDAGGTYKWMADVNPPGWYVRPTAGPSWGWNPSFEENRQYAGPFTRVEK